MSLLSAALVSAALAGPTVIELQPDRYDTTTPGGVRLVDLQPAQNRWLIVEHAGGRAHLENPVPALQRVDLVASSDEGLAIVGPDGTTRCAPWKGSPSALDQAAASPDAYVPICEGRLFVRKDMKGKKSALEWSADLVRDRWAGGDRLAEVVKKTVYKDRFLTPTEVTAGGGRRASGAGHHAPPDLQLVETAPDASLAAPDLGLPVVGSPPRLPVGRYAPLAVEGTWLAAVTPGLAAPTPDRGPVSPLDGKENKALVLLVAFDLARFELDYELGTEHPRVGWSERAPAVHRPPGSTGPDGFDTIAPLARTGQLPPSELDAVVATFTAGFKRQHGAFRSGPLAGRNLGSHYGFVQDGVVLSTPQPGLATLLVTADGRVDLRTWEDSDAGTAAQYRHLRQNGVPLVSWDPIREVPRAGSLVDHWAAGNWSGSAEGQLRSLREGACLVEHGDQRFLVVGWFTAATPAAMARVFLAAGCKAAMLLDMNALEHTYLALYTRSAEGGLTPHHLDKGMAVLDKTSRSGVPMPRFLALPDNRDFFVLRRKESSP